MYRRIVTNILNHKEPNMARPAQPQPLYVRHKYGTREYKVVEFTTDSVHLMQVPELATRLQSFRVRVVPRLIFHEKFVAIDPPEQEQQEDPQSLAASAFLAAHAGSNYLQHPNNNPRSSMGIRK